MTPTITFNTYQELYDYIYEFIITNNNNEIIAVQHNNIESGLLDFVTEAPRNSFKGRVIATAGLYVASVNDCVLIFKTGGTGSIQLTDNRWNEWVIVNLTAFSKQLIGSIASYTTSIGIVKNYVPPFSVVKLTKGIDNKWYDNSSVATVTTATLTTVPQRIQFIVGEAGSYEGSVNESLIQLPENGDTEMVINLSCVSDSVALILAGFGELPRSVTDRGKSYGVEYNSNNVEINIYPNFLNGELYICRFDTTIASVNYGIGSTYFTATTETYSTDPMPELEGAIILQIIKEITPLKPYQYNFDADTLVTTLVNTELPPLNPSETLYYIYLVSIPST